MPRLLMFGAGNIGRGFIAPTFTQAGWRVTFVDLDAVKIDAFNQRGSYTVTEVDDEHAHVVAVQPVDGVLAADRAAVAAAVADADLVATAVGLEALKYLGAPLAAGLALRESTRPLNILICENGADARDRLAAAIRSVIDNDARFAAERAHLLQRLATDVGLVRTSIGRMIPPGAGADALDIAVEPYAHLPVERAAFIGAAPIIPHLELAEDFELVIAQKLYLHNLTHACLAYAGARVGLATIPDAVRDTAVSARAYAAGVAAARAIARVYAPARETTVETENIALLDQLFVRYRNRRLDDPIVRVGRDPFRKLSSDDRLVGAAQRCLRAGVDAAPIIAAILDAAAWQVADDEPRAAEWRLAQARGTLSTLAAAIRLPWENLLMSALALAARRAAAAASMRGANLVITDAEAAAIEIADFGLENFERFGLAIHVYVNTERVCAKELMMLPGQICPEHRHPPIPGMAGQEGELGKEETFRVRAGEVHLFLPGERSDSARAFAHGFIPAEKHGVFTMWKHVHLTPGTQYTLKPNTPHWFVAGAAGAIVSEFSTRSRDEADVFTDPAIQRVPDAA